MMAFSNRLDAAVSAWKDFWFTEVPPHIYAVLRITVGLAGCAVLLSRTDIGAFWDLSGLVPLVGRDPLANNATEVKRWLEANDLGLIAGRSFFALYAGAFIAMTLGVWTRVTVPLAFVAATGQQLWNHLPMSGADLALRGFLFCLLWTDSGAVWSLDAWRGRAAGVVRTATSSAYIAPLRLMRFQLAIIYLGAGLFKLDNAVWRNGSAVYYVLNSNVHQRVPYFVPPDFEFVTTLLTYTTLLWELGFAFMLLYKPTRFVALVLGVCVHIGMFALMEVGPFHLVMLASYPAFLNPQWVPSFAARFSRVYTPVAVDHNSVARSSQSSN